MLITKTLGPGFCQTFLLFFVDCLIKPNHMETTKSKFKDNTIQDIKEIEGLIRVKSKMYDLIYLALHKYKKTNQIR